MTFESAAGFCLALFIWVLIPGPAIFAIIGQSLTKGLRSALKLIAGILLGDLFYISIALFGLAAIGKILGDLFFIIRMMGAGYLIFLGLRLWFKEAQYNFHAVKVEKPDHYKSLLTGFSITLGNPKAILFHLGFLPTFFDLSVISVLDAFCIISIFLTALGGSLFIYAVAASRAGAFSKTR